jgi:hypothetical protein
MILQLFMKVILNSSLKFVASTISSDVRQNLRSSSHQAMAENALTLIAKY